MDFNFFLMLAAQLIGTGLALQHTGNQCVHNWGNWDIVNLIFKMNKSSREQPGRRVICGM